jgi:hypothetical protein
MIQVSSAIPKVSAKAKVEPMRFRHVMLPTLSLVASVLGIRDMIAWPYGDSGAICLAIGLVGSFLANWSQFTHISKLEDRLAALERQSHEATKAHV